MSKSSLFNTLAHPLLSHRAWHDIAIPDGPCKGSTIGTIDEVFTDRYLDWSGSAPGQYLSLPGMRGEYLKFGEGLAAAVAAVGLFTNPAVALFVSGAISSFVLLTGVRPLSRSLSPLFTLAETHRLQAEPALRREHDRILADEIARRSGMPSIGSRLSHLFNTLLDEAKTELYGVAACLTPQTPAPRYARLDR